MRPLTAFWAVAVHSFQRHWRVRQMGWVAAGLLAAAAVVVGLVTASPAGWGPAERRAERGKEGRTHRQYAESLPHAQRPVRDGVASLILSIPAAALNSRVWVDNWAFMNFTRWVMFGVYLGFVLPMFTLAYASGSVGAERESRSLVWLLTRPVPRSAVYLAKFLGTLPWCLLFGVGGFLLLCAAGGGPGRRAAALYWPAAVAGTLALAAFFHLVGAVFRRPVVVGLVYVFFFEALVAALPGSLKKLSLNFYARCLMYNDATAAGYPTGMLGVTGAVPSDTAWAVLLAATAGLTALGMVLFARIEQGDDT